MEADSSLTISVCFVPGSIQRGAFFLTVCSREPERRRLLSVCLCIALSFPGLKQVRRVSTRKADTFHFQCFGIRAVLLWQKNQRAYAMKS